MSNNAVEGAKLPLELLDAIVDELSASTVNDPDSRISLLNCALVCRSLYTRASGHIFSNITFVLKAKRSSDANKILAQKLRDLHSILERNRLLGRRVRSFRLDACYTDIMQASYPEMFLDNAHLPLILDQFSSISKFEWLSRVRAFPWKMFHPRICVAIETLINRPSLTSLSLSAIEYIPVDLIISNGNLKHLSLAHIDIFKPHDDDMPPPDSSCNALKLESHVSHNSADIVFRLLSKSPSMFSELRVLRIWMRRSDEVNAAWTIMQSAAKTLETLDIEDMSHFRYPAMIPGPVDIGILANLRQFAVNCRIASGDGIIFPMGIYGLLNSGTTASRIEHVKITIDWIDCQIGTESRRFVEEPGWIALDEVLSGPKFPAVQNVLLTLKLGYGWRTTQSSGDSPPQIVTALKDEIQSLVAKLLPQTSRASTKNVNVNLLIYRSRYAREID